MCVCVLLVPSISTSAIIVVIICDEASSSCIFLQPSVTSLLLYPSIFLCTLSGKWKYVLVTAVCGRWLEMSQMCCWGGEQTHGGIWFWASAEGVHTAAVWRDGRSVQVGLLQHACSCELLVNGILHFVAIVSVYWRLCLTIVCVCWLVF